MSDDLAGLRLDLAAEQASVDDLVKDLPESGWDTPTPAQGWTVRDQISHLASVDEWAALAAGDPPAFRAWAATLSTDPDAVVAEPVEAARVRSGGDVLAWWRTARVALETVLDRVDPGSRVPWFGPSMAVPTLVTARLMETWAHGEDVAEALGVERPPTARLRHVAHLGVRARAFSFVNRGMPAPAGDVRVELTAPGGELWTWGEEGAASRLSGPALDFCLVVTRRRHFSDTALAAEGELAAEWLAVAQAFAGPPGTDPQPRGGGAAER